MDFEQPVTPLPELAVYRLDGPDAAEWLQGQTTQDIRKMGSPGWARGLLCRPTGQLLAHLDIWRDDDGFFLLVHRAEAPALIARYEEAVIMEEVSLREEKMGVIHLEGAPSRSPLARPRNRALECGYDELVPYPRTGDPEERKRFDAFAFLRGEIVPGLDTNERTLPPELGPAFEAETISYTKGCYTGQEVLMRLHARGRTPRVRIGLLADVALEAGAAVVGEDGREVGRVVRVVETEVGPVAAAMVRREAVDSNLFVLDEGQRPQAVEARSFPILG